MKDLKNMIRNLVQEYMGTGASGGNAGDGNSIVSPRPFKDDKTEVEKAYTQKNVFGAEGGHYRKDADTFNYNRTKMGMFELKDFIKKIVQEIEVEEQAYPHATLTTQGQSIHRAPGVWEEDLQEQLSPGEMKTYNDKKIRHQRAIAKVDIDIARANKGAISAALQAQTAQMGPALSQLEQSLYEINENIILKKDELKQRRNQLANLREQFDNTDPEDEESRTQLLEEIDALKNAVNTLSGEIDGLVSQRNATTKQRDQMLAQKSQASAAASTSMKQADQGIRDQEKAMRQIGKNMEENILKQYLKERVNTNLMEQMDSYHDDTRGSLQQFFKLFDDGLTNSECKMHFSQKGIEVPETYISKVKSAFENYKDLKLKLGFLDDEAKDFKKEIDPFQDIESKQLASGISSLKEHIKKEIIKIKK